MWPVLLETPMFILEVVINAATTVAAAAAAAATCQ
jgi:hypothetical protein